MWLEQLHLIAPFEYEINSQYFKKRRQQRQNKDKELVYVCFIVNNILLQKVEKLCYF